MQTGKAARQSAKARRLACVRSELAKLVMTCSIPSVRALRLLRRFFSTFFGGIFEILAVAYLELSTCCRWRWFERDVLAAEKSLAAQLPYHPSFSTRTKNQPSQITFDSVARIGVLLLSSQLTAANDDMVTCLDSIFARSPIAPCAMSSRQRLSLV